MSNDQPTSTLSERVSRRRSALGLSQAELARSVGMSQQGIVSIEHGASGRPRKIFELAEALHTTPEWLLKGIGHEITPKLLKDPVLPDLQKATSQVPVMGYLGAGAIVEPEYEQVPPEGLDTIDLPFSVPEGIGGFRVRGDSMIPVYRDGDAVLVWLDQRLAIDSYIGEEAAVRTADGRRYLKEIQYGRKKNTYDLYSHNAKLITGVKLEWVGEIYLIVRAGQIRRANKAREVSNRKRALARQRETDGMGELDI